MKHYNRRFSYVLTLALLASLCLAAMPLETSAQQQDGSSAKKSQLMAFTAETLSQSRVDEPLAPPANDNFVNATLLVSGQGGATFTNVDATKETGEPNHGGRVGGKSVWFRWSTTASTSYTFDTLTETNFDTLLAIYRGESVNNLTLVAGNDDYGNTLQSQVTFAPIPNVTYYIAVDGYLAASGSFHLRALWNEASTYNSWTGYATVFRPSTGSWYGITTLNSVTFSRQWGASGDVPAPADYDGDRQTDFAVFRPSTGAWYILRSTNGALISISWGQSGDKPVPGDYTADGQSDVGVFRPSNGTWYIYDLNSAQAIYQQFGQSGDKPVQRDYDGDGKTDIAVFRPSIGTWYISNSFDNSFRAQAWGQPGDIPVPADYSILDGKADIAVFRPSTGTWYVLRSRDNALVATQWGTNGDIPQPVRDDLLPTAYAVFRPSTSTWYFLYTLNGSRTLQWGAPGDIPVSATNLVEP